MSTTGTGNTPLVVARDQLDPVHWIGEEGRWLLRGADTGGSVTFMEITSKPAAGPPLHVHEEVDEAFYVIEGHYRFRVGDEVVDAPAGTLVYGPRGVPHQFENIAQDTSRMLVVSTPGGVERFFEDLGEATGGGTRRPDFQRMAEVAAKHKVTNVGPPPGVKSGNGFGGIAT